MPGRKVLVGQARLKGSPGHDEKIARAAGGRCGCPSFDENECGAAASDVNSGKKKLMYRPPGK